VTGAGPATTGRPRQARLRLGARRTNLGLLIGLVAALVTGGLAFAAGTGWGRPVVVAHGLAGLAVLVLAPWKSVIVRRLSRRSGAGRWTSVAFGALVSSATGYRRRLPLGDARTLLLATRLAGRPLSAGHGFPARLVAPGRRGFWWVNWVVSVELDPAPWWRQSPFPLT